MNRKRDLRLGAGRTGFSVVILVAVLGLCADSSTAQPACATPADGCWSAPVELGAVMVHSVQLHTGKVLLISANNPSIVRLFNPTNDTFSEPFGVSTDHQLFCAGHAQLDDGRVLFYGGTGLDREKATLYTPRTNTWTDVSDSTDPAVRFYPTVTTLADGKMLVTDGSGSVGANTPAVYVPGTLTPLWVHLTDAEYGTITYPFNFPNYPRMFVASNGLVLYNGSAEGGGTEFDQRSRFLDPILQRWIEIFNAPDPIDGGSGVSFALDRFMKAGGKQFGAATNLVYTLEDVTSSTPTWVQRTSMNNARRQFLLVGLPGEEGDVLAVGGEDEFGASVKKPELYNLGADTWDELAEQTNPREYHASAVLLPDARVISAGGNIAPSNTTVEIFSPPYLFTAAGDLADRPEIISLSIDRNIYYNEGFKLGTPDADDIKIVNLIRLGAATHAFDHNQLVRTLDFVNAGPDGLFVAAPRHAFQAPPGYYMLFIVDGNGVPSKAVIVRLLDRCPRIAAFAVRSSE